MLDLERQNELRERYRARRPSWRPATELYAGLARAYLGPDARLLDLGCGRGGVVEQLDHPASLITGLDPDGLSRAEHRLPQIQRVAGESDRAPLRGGTFDLVLASWVLEHLAAPEHTLREIKRLLKPGGVFLFITPNGRHPAAQLNRLLGRTNHLQQRLVAALYGRESADTFPTYYRANTFRQLQRLAAEVRLEVITLAAIPDPTYLAFTAASYRAAVWLEEKLPSSRQVHLVGIFRRPG